MPGRSAAAAPPHRGDRPVAGAGTIRKYVVSDTSGDSRPRRPGTTGPGGDEAVAGPRDRPPPEA
ncbi:hypothetical protein [Kitasatospora sp. NBC_00458]|uniref:hypothetical protein n=1 Tax=Kitasatospora sp. NBC_00458 TaxID=2903568 RepID=UPI002E1952FC